MASIRFCPLFRESETQARTQARARNSVSRARNPGANASATRTTNIVDTHDTIVGQSCSLSGNIMYSVAISLSEINCWSELFVVRKHNVFCCHLHWSELFVELFVVKKHNACGRHLPVGDKLLVKLLVVRKHNVFHRHLPWSELFAVRKHNACCCHLPVGDQLSAVRGVRCQET